MSLVVDGGEGRQVGVIVDGEINVEGGAHVCDRQLHVVRAVEEVHLVHVRGDVRGLVGGGVQLVGVQRIFCTLDNVVVINRSRDVREVIH